MIDYHVDNIGNSGEDKKVLTLRLSVGSFCLNRMSHRSNVPSILMLANTEGLTGLQQASVK